MIKSFLTGIFSISEALTIIIVAILTMSFVVTPLIAVADDPISDDTHQDEGNGGGEDSRDNGGGEDSSDNGGGEDSSDNGRDIE